MARTRKYLFGPVPSRRLGRSLGVDLIPFKTCSMNCTFCQLGETPHATSARGEHVPIREVLDELDRWKRADGAADHITLAGSGEPTLHTRFGDVFRWARENTAIPTVLLTNGSLLHLPEVRRDAALADKVKVTLSAWDEASFRKLHRPAKGIGFRLLVEGERAFRREYGGELSVEVFIVNGVNSAPSQVRKIAEIVQTLEPDRIDLNTAVRPPAVDGVAAASGAHLQSLLELFGPKAQVVASFNVGTKAPAATVDEATLLSLIRRHPATAVQLAKEFNAPFDTVFQTLEKLVARGALVRRETVGEPYYAHREHPAP